MTLMVDVPFDPVDVYMGGNTTRELVCAVFIMLAWYHSAVLTYSGGSFGNGEYSQWCLVSPRTHPGRRQGNTNQRLERMQAGLSS